jgi:cell wall-associated NlpC family hydrolase
MAGRHRAPVPPPAHRAHSQRWARIGVAATVALWLSDRARARMDAEPIVETPPPSVIVAKPPGPADLLRANIVDHALFYVDQVPYRDGGKDSKTGFDCSGLVWQVLKDAGFKVPYRTVAQLKRWTKPIEFADLRPGDLVFYDRHVGVFVGNGQVVDSSMLTAKVARHDMWLDPYPTFGRVPDPGPAPDPSPTPGRRPVPGS